MELGQYCGRWCPGPSHHLVVSSHDTDKQVPAVHKEWFQLHVPVSSQCSRNERKCKYISMFLKTHCGLVTLYMTDLGQHWFGWWHVTWLHQAIAWTNVDLSSVRSSDNHLRAISWEISQPSVINISLKISLKFHLTLPGANELKH